MRDNIWFTYKARIQAYTRLASNDFHSQTLLVWYAVVSAALAIIVIRHSKLLGDDTDIISAIMSVVLLAVSMFVVNQDFRGRAIAMRQNYLALQQIYNTTSQTQALSADEIRQYNNLLSSVENHLEMDDIIFRVLHYSALTSRKPKVIDFFKAYLYRATRTVILVALYTAPIGLVFFG